ARRRAAWRVRPGSNLALREWLSDDFAVPVSACKELFTDRTGRCKELFTSDAGDILVPADAPFFLAEQECCAINNFKFSVTRDCYLLMIGYSNLREPPMSVPQPAPKADMMPLPGRRNHDRRENRRY